MTVKTGRLASKTKKTAAENGATATSAAAPTMVEIPEIQRHLLRLRLVGDSPLICNRFSEKARKQIADKQEKKALQGKEARDPEKEFWASLHKMGPKKYGFPGVGFKKAAITACSASDGITKVFARQCFHVVEDMVEILGPFAKDPVMRTDTVRIGRGITTLAYRGSFPEWEVWVTIDHNARIISVPQIINLFNLAGYGVGVGEWRPERDGEFGRFTVADAQGEGIES